MIKLPILELPTYDGTPENFERFISALDSIFDKRNLSSYEKYSYLLQCLSGPAKQIIDSMPTGNLNYEDARKLLSDAFSSKICQQYSVIEKLTNLKLTQNRDFYQWISEARILSQQVDRLNISGSTFVQYFLWHGLSERFKQSFISKTNKSKPDLNEILENAFDIYNRLPMSGKNNHSDVLNVSRSNSQPGYNYEVGEYVNNVSVGTNNDRNSKKVAC